MKKNNNIKKNTNHNKRFLIFILAFLSIFIITIPIYYVVEYNRNKVTPFTEEIAKLEADGYKIERIKGTDFNEFGFKLVCKKFDVTTNYRAEYTAEVDITDMQIKDLKMKVALTANWIKFNNKSNSDIALKNGKYNPTTYVHDLKPLVEKKNKLLPLPEATTYVLLTYERGPSGNRTKNAFLLEFPYGSYKIDQGGYPTK